MRQTTNYTKKQKKPGPAPSKLHTKMTHYTLYIHKYIRLSSRLPNFLIVLNWGLCTVSVLVLLPVKNVTGIFSCHIDGSLVWFENYPKSDGNPIIFLVNALEIPWLELIQNPCHYRAWRTSKTWIIDKESSWNSVWIWTKLPPSRFVTMWNDMEFP